jgi:putative endonuclease
MKKDELGKRGEELAVEFLVKKGYRILDRNWRHNAKEIDIIARDRDKLVIVEVKSRNHTYYEHPVYAVTVKKQQFLINAADAYIRANDLYLDTRFDVISVVFYPGSFEIDHIDGAFYPTLR